jgi:chromosomal replication initiation ATPase DnaA
MPSIQFELVKKPLEKRLLEAACIYWNVDEDYLKQKCDKQIIVYRRKLLYYLLKTYTSLSLRNIAELFEFANSEPIRQAANEIDTTKGIYPSINRDLKELQRIADKLDAQIITMQVELHTVKF